MYYNLTETIPNYYGRGNHATFFFMGYARYNGEPCFTSNQGSAMLFSKEEAEEAKKYLKEKRIGKCREHAVVECPENVIQDLRCLFI